MKTKILVIILVLCTIVTASAQSWNGNETYLPQGMWTTGEQWHYDHFSILETNRENQYLRVSNSGYSELIFIPPQDIVWSTKDYNTKIYDIRPYYSGQGGWYVSCNKGFYIVTGHPRPYWSRLSQSLIYKSYRYPIMHKRRINYSTWHLCRPHVHRPPAHRPQVHRPPVHRPQIQAPHTNRPRVTPPQRRVSPSEPYKRKNNVRGSNGNNKRTNKSSSHKNYR